MLEGVPPQGDTMPNFIPEGTIRIGRVPFDNSYRHTMTFDSASAQRSYFASVCPQSLSRSDYTYVRINNSIRVPFNAEELYTYNYVMYQNANYGTKWFYAFIVGVNYLNKSTTELVLQLDVMQTWYFDYTLTQGFVEREHVSDDAIGAHTVAEPSMQLLYQSQNRFSDGDLSDRYLVVQTNAWPNYESDDDDDPHGSHPVSGGLYNAVFSGGKYYAWHGFELDDAGYDVGDTWKTSVKRWLRHMNSCGAAQSISAMFMYPVKLSPARGEDYGLEEFTNAMSYTVAVQAPTSLGGYVPRNNKLLTFPYVYCLIDDNNGNSTQLRYEFWDSGEDSEGNSGRILSVQSSLDPTATCIVAPQHYDGVENNVTEAFRFPLTVNCSWVYSAYQTWLAQNALSNVLSIAKGALMLGIPAAMGLAGAAGALGFGAAAVAGGAATLAEGAAYVAGEGSLAAGGVGGAASALAGGSSLLGTVGEFDRMSKVPDSQMGAASGNTLYANQYNTYNVAQMVIRPEYARMVDEFFDMYGYEVDRVKVPNRTGRPSWNYVKMRNSCHRGNVPAQDMALINSIYDAGITFWHTPDIGNYSLDNSL